MRRRLRMSPGPDPALPLLRAHPARAPFPRAAWSGPRGTRGRAAPSLHMPLTTAICAARSLVEVNIGGRARPERNEERGTRNEERGSSRPGATGLLARRPQILAHVVLPRARPSASAVASCRSAHPTQHRTVNPTPGRTLDSWYVGPVTLAWYVGTVFRPERPNPHMKNKHWLAVAGECPSLRLGARRDGSCDRPHGTCTWITFPYVKAVTLE